MTPQFLYGRDSAQFGPFSAKRMRELAAAGTLLPGDDVWQEGSTQKHLASKVGNLFVLPLLPISAAVLRPLEADAPAAAVNPFATAETPENQISDLGPAPMRNRLLPTEVARKKRIVSIRGGSLMGQDGNTVQFRKKCGTCGWEDSCRSTAVIRTGANRVTYFCRKCRKSRAVEMQGITG